MPKKSTVIVSKVPAYFDFLPIDLKAKKICKVISSVVPKGSTLIPSDDESYWLAVAMTVGYKKLGILHGDDSFYYNAARKYNENFSGFIAVSKRITKKLKNHSKCTTIPCGSDLNDNNQLTNKEDVILFVGRLDERSKRISDLIPIINGFLSRHMSYKFLIYGDGPDSHVLDDGIRNSPHKCQIKRYPWTPREKILEQMTKSKILLLTSNFEGMPLSAIEALACGNQIVSSRVSGIEDCNIDTVHIYDIGNISKAIALLEKAINTDIKQAHGISVKYFHLNFEMSTVISKYFKFIKLIKENDKAFTDFEADERSVKSLLIHLSAWGKYLFSIYNKFRFW